MADTLRLIHTAQSNVAVFDALRDRLRPDLLLEHVVRPDLLDRARQGDMPGPEVAALVVGPATLCTCSSIGPLAEDAGALRVDRAAIATAVKAPAPCLIVMAVTSTAVPTMALWSEIAGDTAGVEPMVLTEVWPAFESGRMEDYFDGIATIVNRRLSQDPPVGAVLLAQTSMAPAAARIDHDRVITTPEAGFRAALDRLQRPSAG